MPLTEKGNEIKSKLESEYGKEKGDSVLYAGANSGRFTGIDSAKDGILEGASVPSPMESLPPVCTAAESFQRNRKLWEQPGGSPPELAKD